MGWREFAAVLAVFTGYVGLAAGLPPLDDELYYWCWSKELQWSYYDHPALTAVMIRASTELFGDTILAIRLPACAAMAVVFGVLLNLTRPKGMTWAALLTPPMTFGAVLMTPDTPLLLFWALYLRWLVGVHRGLNPAPLGERVRGEGVGNEIPLPPNPPPARGGGGKAQWLLGGLLLGLGVLGKYTMALAGVCAFLSLLTLGRGRIREWLPGYVLHGVVSLVVASPILIHNIKHDFAPLTFQWEHSMADSEPGLLPALEFAGVQVILFGTLPLVLLPWVFRHWSELTADPRLRACVGLFALPLLFFLLKATRGPLQGNWALAAYLGVWPLAGAWWARCGASPLWRWLTRAAFVIPAACVLVVTVHLLFPLPFVPVQHDRVRRLIERQEQYRRVADTVAKRPAPVFVPTYQLAAGLRFHGVDARQLDGVSRPSHFTQQPDDPAGHPAWYWFADFPLPDAAARRVPPPAGRVDIPLTVRGEVYVSYTLWEYRLSPP